MDRRHFLKPASMSAITGATVTAMSQPDPGPEANDDSEHAEKGQEMGENCHKADVQPLSELGGFEDLRGQLEKIEELRKEEIQG